VFKRALQSSLSGLVIVECKRRHQSTNFEPLLLCVSAGCTVGHRTLQ